MSKPKHENIDINYLLDRSASLADIVERSGVRLRRENHKTKKGLCPFHKEKSPSFIVDTGGPNCRCRFKCFGCGASGRAIDFLMRHQGWDYVETVKFLRKEAGLWDISEGEVKELKHKISEWQAQTQEEDLPEYELVLPAPANVKPLAVLGDTRTGNILRPLDPKGRTHTSLPLERLHHVRDYAGRLLGYVARTPPLDFRDGKKPRKLPLQVAWAKNVRLANGKTGEGWTYIGFPEPRLPYGAELVGLAERTGAAKRYLIIEGEKCQEDAAKVLKGRGFIPVSWIGGAGAWHKTDWSEIAKGEVYLWRDRDVPGHQAMLMIGAVLVAHGCKDIRWVEPPANTDLGWDVSDAIADDGWKADRVAGFIREGKPWQSGAEWAPLPQPDELEQEERRKAQEVNKNERERTEALPHGLVLYLKDLGIWPEDMVEWTSGRVPGNYRPPTLDALPPALATYLKENGLWKGGKEPKHEPPQRDEQAKEAGRSPSSQRVSSAPDSRAMASHEQPRLGHPTEEQALSGGDGVPDLDGDLDEVGSKSDALGEIPGHASQGVTSVAYVDGVGSETRIVNPEQGRALQPTSSTATLAGEEGGASVSPKSQMPAGSGSRDAASGQDRDDGPESGPGPGPGGGGGLPPLGPVVDLRSRPGGRLLDKLGVVARPLPSLGRLVNALQRVVAVCAAALLPPITQPA